MLLERRVSRPDRGQQGRSAFGRMPSLCLRCSVGAVLAWTLACSSSRKLEIAKAAIVVEENADLCDRMAGSFLEFWETVGVNLAAGYSYTDPGEEFMAVAEAGRDFARQVVTAATQGQSDSEEGELLIELYEQQARLCNLALSPGGESRLTFSARRSEIKGELIKLRARREVVLPVDGEAKAAALGPYKAQLAPIALGMKERRTAEKQMREAREAAAIEEKVRRYREWSKVADEQERRRQEAEAAKRAALLAAVESRPTTKRAKPVVGYDVPFPGASREELAAAQQQAQRETAETAALFRAEAAKTALAIRQVMPILSLQVPVGAPEACETLKARAAALSKITFRWDAKRQSTVTSVSDALKSGWKACAEGRYTAANLQLAHALGTLQRIAPS